MIPAAQSFWPGPGLLCLAALLPGRIQESVSPTPAGETAGPIEREWRVRALAREPDEAVCQELLAMDDWALRALALEALRRDVAGHALARRALLGPVAAATDDGHPNVRAAALELAAAARLDLDLEEDVSARLAADLWPPARAAHARWLGATLPAGGAQQLLHRARAGELAAELSLLASGEEAWPQQLSLWLELLEGEMAIDPSRLEAQLRGGVSAQLVTGLREAEAPAWPTELLALHAGMEPLIDGLDLLPEEVLDGRHLVELAGGVGVRHPDLAVELARRLLARAAVDEASAWSLCRAATLASSSALELALGLEDELLVVVLTTLEERAARPAPARLENLLAAGRSLDVRGAALDLVLRQLDVESVSLRAEARRVACIALDDPELHGEAFRGLATAEDAADLLPRLHSSWVALDRPARDLRALPRDVPLEPFRSDLEEALQAGRLPVSAIELLAPFPSSRELLGRHALEQVRRLGQESSEQAEQVLRATIGALGRGGHPGATSDLERIVQALVELGPAAAAGRGKYGIAELARLGAPLEVWSASELPQRLRLEAALGALSRGEEAPWAEVVLVEGYGRCDSLLRRRALEALASGSGADSLGFLRQVAADGDLPLLQRRMALEALVRRGDVEGLASWAGEAREHELCLAWVQGLTGLIEVLDVAEVAETAGMAGRELGGAAETLRDALRGGIQQLPSEGEEARLLLEAELLLARTRLGIAPLEEALGRLELLRTDSDERLRQRWRGESVAAVEFRHDLELRLAALLVELGRAEQLLESLGPLEHLDARLAHGLATQVEGAAGSTGSGWASGAGGGEGLRLELARRAWIALQGEPTEGEFAALRVELLFDLLASAGELGEHELYAGACDELEQDHAFRSRRAVERRLGSPAAWRGLDPRARLAAGRLQARAWAALERGEPAEARRLAALGALRTGFSAAAGEAQERLVDALSN